jgi:hypothetical protein
MPPTLYRPITVKSNRFRPDARGAMKVQAGLRLAVRCTFPYPAVANPVPPGRRRHVNASKLPQNPNLRS